MGGARFGVAIGIGLGACALSGACGGPAFSSAVGPSGAAADGGDATVLDAPSANEGGAPLDAGNAASCMEILRVDPSRAKADGIYAIAMPKGAVQVWCDMTVDGGGWTLVARAVQSPQAPVAFGWTRAMGSPSVDTNAYSLDLSEHPVPFTEILVGQHAGGTKVWNGNAFKFTVPANFVETYRAKAFTLPAPVGVLGTCVPALAGGWMFNFAGYTNHNRDSFFFRDGNADEQFGLQPTGWVLAGTGCDRSGDLDGKPGMIFVR